MHHRAGDMHRHHVDDRCCEQEGRQAQSQVGDQPSRRPSQAATDGHRGDGVLGTTGKSSQAKARGPSAKSAAGVSWALSIWLSSDKPMV